LIWLPAFYIAEIGGDPFACLKGLIRGVRRYQQGRQRLRKMQAAANQTDHDGWRPCGRGRKKTRATKNKWVARKKVTD